MESAQQSKSLWLKRLFVMTYPSVDDREDEVQEKLSRCNQGSISWCECWGGLDLSPCRISSTASMSSSRDRGKAALSKELFDVGSPPGKGGWRAARRGQRRRSRTRAIRAPSLCPSRPFPPVRHPSTPVARWQSGEVTGVKGSLLFSTRLYIKMAWGYQFRQSSWSPSQWLFPKDFDECKTFSMWENLETSEVGIKLLYTSSIHVGQVCILQIT